MSKKNWLRLSPLVVSVLLLMLLSTSLVAAAPAARPIVRFASRSDTTVALRHMPEIPPLPAVLGSIFERPRKNLPNRDGSAVPTGPDPVLQGAISAPSAPSTGANFEGVWNLNGVLPPDTQGDVGPNHYVQMVNLSFAIWDKAGNLLKGPVSSNTLWQGFGGPCETTNDGDPIVLYDHLADRWMMSQFALPNYPRGPFYECIAVSQTPDPLGAWYRYEFTISSSKLNDYPKFGVWPDGYYMSVNQFNCKFIGCSWAGAGVVAFERDQMLNGDPARMVYFDLQNVDSNLGGMLPADLDGPEPPAGAPNPYVQVDDNSWGYSGDQLQVWNFHVDWSNPADSTFTFDRALPTASFDANLCGYSRNCIPQPGGTNVDAISDRLMYRLQYRNFGSYQTMVVNHTVDADGSDHAGIRWYELRDSDSDSGWAIYQQGTYAPQDGTHRWMGSIAMNSAGDIALGYSVSSGSTTYPSIRFTGRLAGDPLGEMTQGEGQIVAGGGYQQHSSGRWGDYSMMSVDPTDDCTFWYTQEYYAVIGNAPWQTRIGSFKLADCGAVDSPPSVTITNPAAGATVSGSVNVTATASDDIGVTQVEFFVDDSSIGVDSDGGDGWSASWDTTGETNDSHTVSATASDTIGQQASDAVSVTVNNPDSPPSVTISNPANGSTVSGLVNVTANASDDHGVAKVEFFVDGSSIGIDSDGGDGWSASWDTTGETNDSHTVSATATDSSGQTGDDTVTVTVNNSAPATVHVGDLDASSTIAPRGRWDATVTITVHDNSEGVIEGALVEGIWGGGTQGGGTCTTDASGQCSVDKANLKNNVTSVTFTVSDVTSSVGAYAPGDNHDPDEDSNGTTITVSQPGSNTAPSVAITAPAEDATFASNATIDFSATATDAEDGDVASSLVWTSDIQGQIGTGGSFSMPLNDGNHIITATATDSAGASGSSTVHITVGNVPPPAYMHVGDLDGSAALGSSPSGKWDATVAITVHDADDNPLANATVSGSWSGGTTGSGSCTTAANGQCTISQNDISKKTASVTFTVDTVTAPSYTYDPAANHDPDGDSDGTTITVSKP